MKTERVSRLILAVGLVSGLNCGDGRLEDVSLRCPDGQPTVTVPDLHYPEYDCATAIPLAEASLTSYHYRKACQDATPDSPMPERVAAAQVIECRVGETGGVWFDVAVCCQGAVEDIVVETSIVHQTEAACSPTDTAARAEGLHYPQATSCEDIIPQAENDLGSSHYKRACEKAKPRSQRPARVLLARVVECRAEPQVPGVSIDVSLCCRGRFLDETEFRSRVWLRSGAEVRRYLGDPVSVSEQPSGLHWFYEVEVARDDRVFPGVTLILVDDRVTSYFFPPLNAEPG